MHYRMDPEQHTRIFGPRDPDLDEGAPGRSRKCRVCGGWHRLDRPWPHNCRSEPPPRAPLAAPQLTPSFEPYRTGLVQGEVISSRNEKREYMKRHDLVEYDPGVGRRNEWVERRESERKTSEVIRNFMNMDTESINAHLTRRSSEPIDITNMRRVGEDSTNQAGEIDVSEVEVIK